MLLPLFYKGIDMLLSLFQEDRHVVIVILRVQICCYRYVKRADMLEDRVMLEDRDTQLRETMRIWDNFAIIFICTLTELVLKTYLRMSHELPTKFGPKFSWNSHICPATFVRHSRDQIACCNCD